MIMRIRTTGYNCIKAVRSELRRVLGPELIMVSLSMEPGERIARLMERHGGDTSSAEVMEVSAQYSVLST